MNNTRNIEIKSGDNRNIELHISGEFEMEGGLTDPAPYTEAISGGIKRVVIIDDGITNWDSALLVFVSSIRNFCIKQGAECDLSRISDGVQRLIKLAAEVPERSGAARSSEKISFVENLGIKVVSIYEETIKSVAFIGGASCSFWRLLRGKAQFSKDELFLHIQQCGPGALGIVTTICVLVGAILAFVGAIQLKMFGAEVYVANLVGIGMVMEMGALMTGIILSGRTGASFAAQIGTMQVNEEIDALETLGISPMDYLVMPRMAALIIMTPLLVIYADILGILGGAAVGIFMLDIPTQLFFNQTFEMMTMWQCVQGLIKGVSFGLIVAISGCMRGMQCGRSASAVGDAATSAVVTSIVALVVADAILTLIFMLIG
jgi:phospholipid/cholesterol/gamma-HCH transport system permease protein